MDERPEAMLKSALEKIVYFETRGEQLSNDLSAARSEIDRLKLDLASAAQREIELRRQLAELEVRVSRAHAEREELGRANEALRTERADLIGKMIEANRIHASDKTPALDSEEPMFDLATFISELRSEVITSRGAAPTLPPSLQSQRAPSSGLSGPPSLQAQRAMAASGGLHPAMARANLAPQSPSAPPVLAVVPAASAPRPMASASAVGASPARASMSSMAPTMGPSAQLAALSPVVATSAAGSPVQASATLSTSPVAASAASSSPSAARLAAAPSASAVATAVVVSAPEPAAPSSTARVSDAGHQVSAVVRHAERLQAEGRLQVSAQQLSELARRGEPFAGRSEETLFGFSVRELAAPDAQARVRAAERLKALGHAAAAPPLAAALHAETEPSVQVALLNTFATFAPKSGGEIVTPLLQSPSPEVRVAALKALMTIDPAEAGPHLSAAIKDPDRAVRRRASLLALGLAGESALALGEEAIRDPDPEVRSLAALILGASGGEKARTLLLSGLRDPDRKVRHSAAQSLSRLLGTDVSNVVSMDDAQRRREVRRISGLPARPVDLSATRAPPPPVEAAPERIAPEALTSPSADPNLELEPPAPARPARPASPPKAAKPTARATGPEAPKSSLPPPERVEPPAAEKARDAAPPAAPSAPRPEAKVATPPRIVTEEVCQSVLTELRTAIRGRTLADLAWAIRSANGIAQEACELLVARGQAVKRGVKYFAA